MYHLLGHSQSGELPHAQHKTQEFRDTMLTSDSRTPVGTTNWNYLETHKGVEDIIAALMGQQTGIPHPERVPFLNIRINAWPVGSFDITFHTPLENEAYYDYFGYEREIHVLSRVEDRGIIGLVFGDNGYPISVIEGGATYPITTLRPPHKRAKQAWDFSPQNKVLAQEIDAIMVSNIVRSYLPAARANRGITWSAQPSEEDLTERTDSDTVASTRRTALSWQ